MKNFIIHHPLMFAIIIIAVVIIIPIVSIFFTTFLMMFRRALNKIIPSTTPSWKIAMRVIHPNLARPRFLSLHTLAFITGEDDLLRLARKMKKSGEVNIGFCSTVKSPVFSLKEYRHEDAPEVWDRVPKFIKIWPFPAYKGFQGVSGHWTGGSYGTGRYVEPVTAMAEPFIKQDYRYANKIIDALLAAGREPGMQKYTI